MSKNQLYPNLTTTWLIKNSRPVKVLILYKNGAQYNLCNVEGKYTFHATEKQLTRMIEEAKLLNSPLGQALE